MAGAADDALDDDDAVTVPDLVLETEDRSFFCVTYGSRK
jgi:hypothetical protein